MSFKCNICGKVFNRNDNLTRHMNNVHKQLSNELCEKCGKYFANVFNLKRHLKICKGSNISVVDSVPAEILTPSSFGSGLPDTATNINLTRDNQGASFINMASGSGTSGNSRSENVPISDKESESSPVMNLVVNINNEGIPVVSIASNLSNVGHIETVFNPEMENIECGPIDLSKTGPYVNTTLNINNEGIFSSNIALPDDNVNVECDFGPITDEDFQEAISSLSDVIDIGPTLLFCNECGQDLRICQRRHIYHCKDCGSDNIEFLPKP